MPTKKIEIPNKPDWEELGSLGIEKFMGFVQEAYQKELQWPSVQPLYNRIRRSDPEISVVRLIFMSMAKAINLEWELPDEPSDDDKRAQEFAYQVFEDMEGGTTKFIDTLMSHVPFFGWGWWEVVPAPRLKGWMPPDDSPWRSHYNDGRIGIRKLGWRDSSSFKRWELDNKTGQLFGMVQQDFPNKEVFIPLNRSLHVTFGDSNNPEGLSPLEAVWRLERIKYGLEVVQGIGFEHSAGYLDVRMREGSRAKLDSEDKALIRKSARAVLSAQEGNYAIWPNMVDAEIKDVSFQAATAVLDSIRYFGTLKLMVYQMQWAALSATTGAGSYAAMSDSSSMFMVFFNAMIEGFVNQVDKQLGERLFDWNSGAFPGMTARPRLVATPIQKNINLSDLGSFLTSVNSWMELDDDDLLAIRRHTGFLPEKLPVSTEEKSDSGSGDNENGDKEPTNDDAKKDLPPDQEDADLSSKRGPMGRVVSRFREFLHRPFKISPEEFATDVEHEHFIQDDEITRAVRKFRKWAEKEDPDLAGLLDSQVVEEGE